MRKFAILTVAAVTSLTIAPSSIAFAQQALKDRLIGTWKVVSWESVRRSGPVLNVWMGLHPTGLIIYRPNGYMAVQFMADPRPTFAQLPEMTPPPYDEFRNAYFGYFAYWGTYTINEAGNEVVHHVQGSERPEVVGRDNRRLFSINGANLVITTPCCYKAGQFLRHDLLERMQIPADEELYNRVTFERVE
jgi:hypothetical protein